MLATSTFIILASLIASSLWLKGRSHFVATQVVLGFTFITWLYAFGFDNSLGLFAIFSFIALLINVKFITQTSFFYLTYTNIANFKRACSEKEHLTALESFTLYGFYILAGCMWSAAIFIGIRKWL